MQNNNPQKNNQQYLQAPSQQNQQYMQQYYQQPQNFYNIQPNTQNLPQQSFVGQSNSVPPYLQALQQNQQYMQQQQYMMMQQQNQQQQPQNFYNYNNIQPNIQNLPQQSFGQLNSAPYLQAQHNQYSQSDQYSQSLNNGLNALSINYQVSKNQNLNPIEQTQINRITALINSAKSTNQWSEFINYVDQNFGNNIEEYEIFKIAKNIFSNQNIDDDFQFLFAAAKEFASYKTLIAISKIRPEEFNKLIKKQLEEKKPIINDKYKIIPQESQYAQEYKLYEQYASTINDQKLLQTIQQKFDLIQSQAIFINQQDKEEIWIKAIDNMDLKTLFTIIENNDSGKVVQQYFTNVYDVENSIIQKLYNYALEQNDLQKILMLYDVHDNVGNKCINKYIRMLYINTENKMKVYSDEEIKNIKMFNSQKAIFQELLTRKPKLQTILHIKTVKAIMSKDDIKVPSIQLSNIQHNNVIQKQDQEEEKTNYFERKAYQKSHQEMQQKSFSLYDKPSLSNIEQNEYKYEYSLDLSVISKLNDHPINIQKEQIYNALLKTNYSGHEIEELLDQNKNFIEKNAFIEYVASQGNTKLMLSLLNRGYFLTETTADILARMSMCDHNEAGSLLMFLIEKKLVNQNEAFMRLAVTLIENLNNMDEQNFICMEKYLLIPELLSIYNKENENFTIILNLFLQNTSEKHIKTNLLAMELLSNHENDYLDFDNIKMLFANITNENRAKLDTICKNNHTDLNHIYKIIASSQPEGWGHYIASSIFSLGKFAFDIISENLDTKHGDSDSDSDSDDEDDNYHGEKSSIAHGMKDTEIQENMFSISGNVLPSPMLDIEGAIRVINNDIGKLHLSILGIDNRNSILKDDVPRDNMPNMPKTQGHALTFVSIPSNTGAGPHIVLIDPESIDTSIWVTELANLRDVLLDAGGAATVDIVYTSIQSPKSGTCADISLHILACLAEQGFKTLSDVKNIITECKDQMLSIDSAEASMINNDTSMINDNHILTKLYAYFISEKEIAQLQWYIQTGELLSSAEMALNENRATVEIDNIGNGNNGNNGINDNNATLLLNAIRNNDVTTAFVILSGLREEYGEYAVREALMIRFGENGIVLNTILHEFIATNGINTNIMPMFNMLTEFVPDLIGWHNAAGQTPVQLAINNDSSIIQLFAHYSTNILQYIASMKFNYAQNDHYTENFVHNDIQHKITTIDGNTHMTNIQVHNLFDLDNTDIFSFVDTGSFTEL